MHNNSHKRGRRVLRLPGVMAKTGLSRSKIYFLISEGTFDPGIELGARMRGWFEDVIDDWLEARPPAAIPAPAAASAARDAAHAKRREAEAAMPMAKPTASIRARDRRAAR